jgi:hypothetical protein
MPLAWWQTLAIFLYAMLACLAADDSIKIAMIKWRVPALAGSSSFHDS